MSGSTGLSGRPGEEGKTNDVPGWGGRTRVPPGPPKEEFSGMPQQIMSPPQLVWALAMLCGITFFCLSMFPVPSSMTNPPRHSCQLTQTNLAGQMPIGGISRF